MKLFWKLTKIMHFLLFSKEILEIFLKHLPTNCVFCAKRENLTRSFLNFFKKSPKIIHFLIFLRNFLEIFKIFWPLGRGLRPLDPLRGRPPKMFLPRTEILAAPLRLYLFAIIVKLWSLESEMLKKFHVLLEWLFQVGK